MAKFSLACYNIKIKVKGTNSYVLMNNFRNIRDGATLNTEEVRQNNDAYYIFRYILHSLSNRVSHDMPNHKVLRIIDSREDETSRTLCGIIQAGEYEYESDLYNVENNAISYRRQRNDAEMLPFYFLLHLPTNRDESIFILQRFKQFGIKSLMSKNFRSFFIMDLSDFELEIKNLIPEYIVNYYLRSGKVKKITFTKYGLPSDFAETIGDHEEEDFTTELSVHARPNKEIPIIGPILNCRQRNEVLSSLFSFDDFDYNTIRMEVKIGNNKRMVDFSNLYKLRAYFDITEDITIGDNGHPTFESIDRVARELLQEIREAIYI